MRDRPPVTRRIHRLEALRGFAALYVVLHHTLPYELEFAGINVAIAWRFGQEAVILFFLVSGFVIKYSFETGSDKRFGVYFARRFYRIYIPLFMVFVLGYVANSFNAGHPVPLDGGQLLGNLLMLQDLERVKPNVLFPAYLGNEPLWSLSYEWWFYMLFYPLNRYITPARRRNVVVLGLAMVAALAFVATPNFLTRLFMYLSIWWSGVMLAEAYLAGQHRKLVTFGTPVAVLLVIAAATLVNVIWRAGQGDVMTFGLYPVLELRHMGFAVAVLIAAWYWQRRHWQGFDLLFSPFLLIAPISYALYIVHYHSFTSATYFAFIDQPVIEWLLYLAVTLAVSWLIERRAYPAIRQRLSRRHAA